LLSLYLGPHMLEPVLLVSRKYQLYVKISVVTKYNEALFESVHKL